MKLRRRKVSFYAAVLLFAASATINADNAPGAMSGTARYVVRFEEPGLARYNGVVSATGGSSASLMPLKQRANGRTRLDVDSEAAKSYVDYAAGRISTRGIATASAGFRSLSIRCSTLSAAI
jgi:hypothetical protein